MPPYLIVENVNPFWCVVAWLLAFVANTLLWPVYLIPFGSLGSLIALAVLLGLAALALVITFIGTIRGLRSRRKAAGVVINAILPLFMMASSVVFLTLPLLEFSHTAIYGPRDLKNEGRN